MSSDEPSGAGSCIDRRGNLRRLPRAALRLLREEVQTRPLPSKLTGFSVQLAVDVGRLLVLGALRAPSRLYPDRWSFLDGAVRQASREGLWLEFGVYRGASINYIARRSEANVFGFDSFEGLPSGWTRDLQRGAFSSEGAVPAVEPNVTLVKGWFEESLPPFLKEIGPRPVAFLHIDSDLYSSAKFVLHQLASRIRAGTVIVFDEFCGPILNDEERAFREAAQLFRWRFRLIGCSLRSRVALQIISIVRESDSGGRPSVKN